jgi:hypothetical protein
LEQLDDMNTLRDQRLFKNRPSSTIEVLIPLQSKENDKASNKLSNVSEISHISDIEQPLAKTDHSTSTKSKKPSQSKRGETKDIQSRLTQLKNRRSLP